jgi:hypothetical protein
MSQFATNWSAGAEVILSMFGQSATYVDGETSTVLTARCGPINGSEETDPVRNRRNVRRRTVTISLDPNGSFGGVASPKESAYFTIGSESWSIEAIEYKGNGMARLACIQTGRTGYDSSRMGK